MTPRSDSRTSWRPTPGRTDVRGHRCRRKPSAPVACLRELLTHGSGTSAPTRRTTMQSMSPTAKPSDRVPSIRKRVDVESPPSERAEEVRAKLVRARDHLQGSNRKINAFVTTGDRSRASIPRYGSSSSTNSQTPTGRGDGRSLRSTRCGRRQTPHGRASGDPSGAGNGPRRPYDAGVQFDLHWVEGVVMPGDEVLRLVFV